MSNELVTTESALAVMPALTIQEAVSRRDQLVAFVQKILQKDHDFGVIPGTGSKATLFKPGAEKLTTFFGLAKRFICTNKIEDWTGKDHGGEPFFYYSYTCQLFRGDHLIAESEASCNSWEARYRWRNTERKCPECGKEAIIKGKQEYGGGWLCWNKPEKGKHGCGSKFRDGDQRIEGQEVGKKANPDIFDQVNTLQKMGQKRALIAATLLAVNASEFFTQDLDDFDHGTPEVVEAEYEVKKPAPPKQPAKSNGTHKPPADQTPQFTSMDKLKAVHHRLKDRGLTWAEALTTVLKLKVSDSFVEPTSEDQLEMFKLTDDQVQKLYVNVKAPNVSAKVA